MKAPLPANEADRLAALYSLQLLDTPPEPTFDDLALLAAQLCDTPIALITLVDSDRQWIKAKVGTTLTEVSRDVSFCAHAILQPDEVLIIADTLADERFATNPLVTTEPHIRFYAGAPLLTPAGYALGTLCIIDYVPRQLTSEQLSALLALRRAVMTEIQLQGLVGSLFHVVAERDQAVSALQEVKQKLEMDILERTAELRQANDQLQIELAERQRVEDRLKENIREIDLAYHQASIYARELNAKIAESKQAEEALAEERALLARRVEERTAELSAANAELARTARAKDEFLASMSHELRTPLNAILGLTEALQEQTRGPLNEHQLKSLRTIEESGRHLLALINDVLDIAKVEAGKLELQLDLISVEMICQTSLQFIKEAAARKKIEVSFTPEPAVTSLYADARRLKQILVNLLSNAVKFTPEGGQVGLAVRGEAELETVHFTIWDTGPGIAPEDLPRLFKPFVQLDSRLSRQYEGTGLGLALVSRLVELHGGSVSVESDGVSGHGSSFTISLPWQADNTKLQFAEEGQRPPVVYPPLTGAKPPAADGRRSVVILLAEDNEANIGLLTDYLGGEGYHIVVARNGVEAVDRAREEKPALILMDIQMPEMDGLEATRRIRAETQLTHTPIIALTALAMPEDRERCLAAGANDYLSKPVSLKKLVDTIELHLK